MAALVTILSWLVGIIGAVLLLVLLMPLSLRAAGAAEPWQADGLVDARWAWGLLGVHATPEKGIWLRVFGLSVARIKRDDDKKKKDKPKREKERAKDKVKKRSKRGIRWGLNNRALFRRLVRALHFQGEIWGTIGLDDPADTAQLAILLRALPLRLPGFETHLYWNYIDEVLALEGAVQARIWPAELVWIGLATLARGESRRALLASNRDRRPKEISL